MILYYTDCRAHQEKSTVSELEVLAAIEQIKQLKARYFRCMDTKDWAGLRSVFTSNALFDVRGALELPKPDSEYAEPIVTGLDAIVSYISTGLGPLVSVHHGHMPEIDILSSSEARGIWPMSDLLSAPPGAPFRLFRGYGHYHETYRKIDGQWRIETLRLRRLYVESESPKEHR
jgi:SnoaL-like domain